MGVSIRRSVDLFISLSVCLLLEINISQVYFAKQKKYRSMFDFLSVDKSLKVNCVTEVYSVDNNRKRKPVT